MANYRVAKLCEAKVWDTAGEKDHRFSVVTNRVCTQCCTFCFVLRLLRQYLLLLLQLRFCSAVQLGLWFWPRLGARRTTTMMQTAPGFPFIGYFASGKTWKIKLFPKPVGGIAKIFSIDHIFYVILLFLAKGLHLGKIFERVVYHRFEHRFLIATISHKSSAHLHQQCFCEC